MVRAQPGQDSWRAGHMVAAEGPGAGVTGKTATKQPSPLSLPLGSLAGLEYRAPLQSGQRASFSVGESPLAARLWQETGEKS